MVPGFPNFAGKHGHEGLISPRDIVSSIRDREELVIPDAVVLTYQGFLLEFLQERGDRRIEGYPSIFRDMYLARESSPTVAVVGGFGIGAPAASIVLEDLTAMGVRRFVSIGGAGSLQ